MAAVAEKELKDEKLETGPENGDRKEEESSMSEEEVKLAA